MAFTPPVSKTVDYDALVSTTLNNTRDQRFDAIFRKSAFWSFMHLNGRKELFDGGTKIQRAVDYAVNGTVASYEGYDRSDLTPQDTTTSLIEDLREVAGSITISRREERQNSGKSQIISLITSKIENLDRSFGQKLNEFLLNPSGAGMTAGNSGKDLLPLTEIITINGQSGAGGVHSIVSTGSSNTWWNNQFKAGTATPTLIQFKGDFRNFYNTCSKHNDGPPNLVLTNQEVHEKYEESLEGQVRYGSTELANLGFETVMLRGAQVLWDEIVPRTKASAYVAFDEGTSTNKFVAFFLNTDFLKLYVDSQTDLVNRPFMDSIDQTAKSALVLFMGQLICTNRRTQGVLYDIVVA